MNYNYYRNERLNLFSPEHGYNLGNMFQDLYDTYKNYKIEPLRASDAQEKAYLELSRIAFAMHEMNLYLDVHPNDRTILQLFNDYRKMLIQLEKEYEKMYGPLAKISI